jgi:hypothetical protein
MHFWPGHETLNVSLGAPFKRLEDIRVFKVQKNNFAPVGQLLLQDLQERGLARLPRSLNSEGLLSIDPFLELG